MATKTIALKTDIQTAYAKIAQSLTQNKAEITNQQAPTYLSYTMSHSSIWTAFMKIKLDGSVNLEAMPDGHTVARVEINPAQNSLMSNVGMQGILSTVIGFLFLGPLALLIMPLASVGTYMYLNNSMGDQTLEKLGGNVPGAAPTPVQVTSSAAPAPQPAAPQPAAQNPIFAQLKSLGELRDSGVLSPEEFETKKAELLARV
jgi:hypothetical protein